MVLKVDRSWPRFHSDQSCFVVLLCLFFTGAIHFIQLSAAACSICVGETVNKLFLSSAQCYRPCCWSELITVLIKRTTISDILFQQLTHLEGPPGRGGKAREKEGREGKGKGYPTIATNENPGNGFDYVGLFALPHGNAIPFTFIRVKTVVKTQRHIG